MRILICDDDTLIIEQLQKYIASYFESCHLKCPQLDSFTCGESLLADQEEKDIVFLDIEMPDVNGIHIGNELKRANKNVIIFVVTSYFDHSTIHLSDQQITAYLTRRKYSAFKNAYLLYLESMR